MQSPAKTFRQLMLNCGEALLYGAIVGAGLIAAFFVTECACVLIDHFFGTNHKENHDEIQRNRTH